MKVLFFISTDSNLVPFAFRDLNLNFYSQGKKKKKKLISKLRPVWIGSFLDIFAGCIPFSIMLLHVCHASKKKEVWEGLLWKYFYIGDELKT